MQKNFLSLLMMAFLGLSSCTKQETSTQAPPATPAADASVILVGEVGSMTGSEATFGVSTHNGIEMAIKETNAAGGIKGKQIKLVTLDDQSKNEEVATATTKLVTQEKVVAVLGEVASSRSLVMAPIAQQNKIPMITPSSTNPKVTEVGDYIFRVCFIDPFQGEVMAKFALSDLKAKKVAILRDMKSDYSIGLADYFKENFVKGGGTIVIDTSYSGGDADFKSQLTAIKSKHPDAIFVPGYYGEVGTIAKQSRQLGIKAPFLGGDGWDSPKLIEGAGDALDGSYFANHYSNENTSPIVQDFIKKFKEVYGVGPDGLSAQGYDAAKVLIGAMNRAPSTSPSDIRAALATTKDYQGVTGNISINELRNAVKSAVVLKVVGKDFKYHSTVNP